MTLAQLQSFVLVARLGSVKAAAAELQVTEPAVSVAVARCAKSSPTTSSWARAAASRSHRAPAAWRAGERDPRPGRAGAALGARVGRRASADAGRRDRTRRRAPRAVDRRVHCPRRGARDRGRGAPGRRVRLTGAGLFLARSGIEPGAVSTYSSQAAANAAAAAGEGIVLTLAHSILDEVRRRALVRLDVRGTPLVELWHASTLGVGRALPAALALQRFATTSEATQALSTGRAGAVSTRARPKGPVTLWRSVADGIDAAAGR